MSKKIIEVEWYDTVGYGRWMLQEERSVSTNNMKHRSVGYLIEEHTDYVLIAQSLADENKANNDVLQIPRGAIQRITALRKR